MILALDLGNSALKAACFDGDEATRTARFQTTQVDWQEAFTIWLEALRDIDAVGLASVVPSTMPDVMVALAETGLPIPIGVHAALPLPLRVAYASPETLGADRLAAAVAAWNHYGPERPIVALDAGTAITYEVVSADGVYMGGAVAPGPNLLIESLNRGTAQLPPVPFDEPASVIGDSTMAALQAGLVYGFLDGIEGMLRRIRARLGDEVFVVATGGWADWIARRVSGIDAIRPLLVLEGIRDIVRGVNDADLRR